MAKRASTGYSFVVGVDKPAGITSHDVVNVCRRIYRERRIGHMGTLDPDATGALLVCVGPAARLGRFLTGHDKVYEFSIVFGSATDTDDASGTVLRTAPIPLSLRNVRFARSVLDAMRGEHMQVPPAYSAIKINGRKAYQDARIGKTVGLNPRRVVVDDFVLLSIDEDGTDVTWKVRASVSAGTYVRSLARDIGESLGTYAHVGELRRVRVGVLDVGECVSLDALAAKPFAYMLDPVRLMGLRVAFVQGRLAALVAAGNPIPLDVSLTVMEPHNVSGVADIDACERGFAASHVPLKDGERLSIVSDGMLKAVYMFDADRSMLTSCCVFATGVQRGTSV